jgi:hypothetical protein
MRKILGLTIAMALALSLPAAAEEKLGTIRFVDTANHAIVLDDGTRLWVSESQMSGLSQGDSVKASYETKGQRPVVTNIVPAQVGPDGTVDPLDSMQSD